MYISLFSNTMHGKTNVQIYFILSFLINRKAKKYAIGVLSPLCKNILIILNNVFGVQNKYFVDCIVYMKTSHPLWDVLMTLNPPKPASPFFDDIKIDRFICKYRINILSIVQSA